MLRPASRGRVQGRDQSGFYSRGSYEQGATMQGNASECSFSYFVGFRGTFGFNWGPMIILPWGPDWLSAAVVMEMN